MYACAVGKASAGRSLSDSRVGHRADSIWQAHGSTQGNVYMCVCVCVYVYVLLIYNLVI